MSTPTRTGAAVVHLRGGNEYVAESARLEAGVLTFTGRLRVRDLAGERLYEPCTESRKLRAGEWVDWQAA